MFARSPFVPYDDSPCDADHRDVEMIRVGRWPAQPLEWLWPQRAPVGKVTLIVGDPGCGKSLVALDIAARTTRALPWPDEKHAFDSSGPSQNSRSPDSTSPALQPSTLNAQPSSVLLLSAEDDLADTIRPRLDAAGADAHRVFILPGIADLRHDFAQLEAAVNRTPDCRLIIVDPISAYVGPNDSHFQTVVRKVLAPLARLAAERRIAVVAVAHFRKTHGAAIYRAAGSMGFVSAARSVWTVCPDHATPGNHFFLPLKTNLTATACGLSYRIDSHESGHAVVRWDSAPATISADAALAPPPRPRPLPPAELAAARDWLRQTRAAGPRPAKRVLEEAHECGFPNHVIRRAFHELDGHIVKEGLHHGWWWSLTDQPTSETCVDTPKTPFIFEDFAHKSDTAAHCQFENLWPKFDPPSWSPTPIFAGSSVNRLPLSESKNALDRLRRERDAASSATPLGLEFTIDQQTYDRLTEILRGTTKQKQRKPANDDSS